MRFNSPAATPSSPKAAVAKKVYATPHSPISTGSTQNYIMA